jgi:serine/threonine protein kinase
MNAADDKEEILFREARQQADGSEQEYYLTQACAGDPALRRRLDALLQTHDNPDPFLEPRAAPPGDAHGRLPPKESPGALIGRYKLLEEMGEGTFGPIFMAEQTEPVHRKVALKIIKAGMDTREVIARFEAERHALALMDHPNIAKILDAGVTGGAESGIGNLKSQIHAGRPYFVMELVPGIPLTAYCEKQESGTDERLRLFMQVCAAVQHAHQKGIIHRDLKPTNVLVTEIDGQAVPKVIDFGAAKALGRRLTDQTLFTAFQQMIGTPAYMSPEQAALGGVDVDTRSDIYSLGVLLYELLTGVTPFDADTLGKGALDEIRRLIRETEPPKPSNQFLIRASGGVGIGSDAPTHPLELGSGAHCTAGGTWVNGSDRNAKTALQPVDGQTILARVLELPLSTWHYRAEDASQRHLGPMAQDFHAAFGLGANDKHIATIDADGVALAALQGLNQKVEARSHESEASSRKLEAENAELKRRLERLEQLLAAKDGGAK